MEFSLIGYQSIVYYVCGDDPNLWINYEWLTFELLQIMLKYTKGSILKLIYFLILKNEDTVGEKYFTILELASNKFSYSIN